MGDTENKGKAWGSSSGSWADAEDDNDEAPHGGSAWGNPVDYRGGSDDEGSGRFRDEEFPAVGSQPTRRQPERSGDYDRRSERNESGGPSSRERGDRYREDRDDREDRYGRRDRNYENREPYGRDRGYGGRGRERSERGYEREREERPPVPFPTSPPWTAHVGNLSYEMRQEDLDSFFIDHGCEVKNVRLLTERDGKPKGYGYVEFADEESLRRALDCSGKEYLGRPLRVGVAERRKERDSGFTSRRDVPREGGSYPRRDNESQDDEAKTWRSQRQARVPISDPLHPERKPDESAVPAKPKPKSNPFGDAKPRDEREAEKKLIELQKQREEEEKKQREEEKKKKEEEILKKKQEKEAQKQKEAVSQQADKSSASWRAEKGPEGKAAAGWSSKKRNDAGRSAAEGKRDPKRAPANRFPAKRADSAGRGERKTGAPAGGRGQSKAAQPATQTKEQAPRQESKDNRRPPRTEKATQNSDSVANKNAYALLGEDEEA